MVTWKQTDVAPRGIYLYDCAIIGFVVPAHIHERNNPKSNFTNQRNGGNLIVAYQY